MLTLRTLIGGNDVVVAPGAFNGLMAMLAKAAGFRALYLSGGSLGWLKGVTEATIGRRTMLAGAGATLALAGVPPFVRDARAETVRSSSDARGAV